MNNSHLPKRVPRGIAFRTPALALVALAFALALAALAGSPGAGSAQTQAEPEAARYEVKFTGLFDADALAAGAQLPDQPYFRRLIGSRHDDSVSYWTSGGTASSGMKDLAELGSTYYFYRENDEADVDADERRSFRANEGRLSPTAETTLYLTTDTDFPLVTMASRILPSPDWFVGVDSLDLRSNGEWQQEISMDLYAWDAGTEEGSDFDKDNPATDPQGVITSLRNTSPFSDNPIARVTFKLMPPEKVDRLTVVSGAGALRASWAESKTATGYRVQWKSGSQGFEDASSNGREHVINQGSTSDYTIPNLTYGSEYTVRVIATNVVGDGEPSLEATATVVDPYADDVLVSNTGRPGELLGHSLSSGAPEHIQGFTTGSRASLLEEVVLSGIRDVAPNTAISVSIYSDSSYSSQNLLHSVDGPETLSAGNNVSFAIPAGTDAVLQANTTYYIWIERTSGSLTLMGTRSDAEDPQSDPGWSLANECLYNHEPSVGHQSSCLSSSAIKVSVKGRYLPALSIADASATEGSDVAFTVTLSAAVSEAVTVQYDTGDGTATSDANATDGADYTAATGQTLTFSPGEVSKEISIVTSDDTAVEEDETFTLTLSNPSSNAEIAGTGAATGTIVNNDVSALSGATLSSLSLTDSNGAEIALSPSFSRLTSAYTASVSNDVESLTVAAVRNESGAAMVFVDADDTSNPGQGEYELQVGENPVEVKVTSEDGNHVTRYRVTVTRAASNDATLTSVTLTDSSGTAVDLSPSFSSGTAIYTASVPNEIESVNFSVARTHDGASVLIVTDDRNFQSESATIALSPGDTIIKAMITAEDGATVNLYKVIVTRSLSSTGRDARLSSFDLTGSDGNEVLLSVSFSPDSGLYYARVPNDVTSVVATAVPNDSDATLEFEDGTPTGTAGQVTRDLDVGSNRVKVRITGASGKGRKIYIAMVTRADAGASSDAALSGLAMENSAGTAIAISPAPFDPSTTAYTASVENPVSRVTVSATATDSNARVLIFSEDGTHRIDSKTIGLNVGDNTVTVKVFAADASTVRTYVLTVSRAAAAVSDSTLSALTLSASDGTALALTPGFDVATTTYTASVGNATDAVTLSATKNRSGATATIIAPDGTGTADSATAALDVGENLIKAMVTSEDLSTTTIYMVTVTRAASADATLSSLVLADGSGSEISLTPAFDPATGLYEALVEAGVDSLTLTIAENHDGAEAVFVGATGTGTPGEATQALVVGENLVKVMVTAEDDTTVKIYMVTVTRPSATVWTATLTVDRDGTIVPAGYGYSLWGGNIDGTLSSDTFTIEDDEYRTQLLVHMAGGVYFSLSRHLPADFVLRLGNVEYRGSDSQVPNIAGTGKYWWADDQISWTQGQAVEVSLAMEQSSLPELENAPPSAYFSNVPDSHNGLTPFTFRLTFTDDVRLSFRTLRDEAFEVTNGTVTRAKRANKGSNRNWTITVRPDSQADIDIRLPATENCSDQGAICTSDGRWLHNQPAVTVPVSSGD